jgi:hypothetical protein
MWGAQDASGHAFLQHTVLCCLKYGLIQTVFADSFSQNTFCCLAVWDNSNSTVSGQAAATLAQPHPVILLFLIYCCCCCSRRPRQAFSLVVEVSRHRYGGRLVSVHSNIQLVNSSGLTLQLGYLSPMALSAQPLPLATLAPGDAVWLPVQVSGSLSALLPVIASHCIIPETCVSPWQQPSAVASATVSSCGSWGYIIADSRPCLTITAHYRRESSTV